MTRIIWKELRENLRWAVLWMLGMALAMAYTISRDNQPTAYWGGDSISSGEFQLVTTVGCALGGLLLGLLQIIPEMRRDQWAFLVHRPVPRNTIFVGKLLAGHILYLGATGLPFLVAAMWCSRPGHIAAPFDARLALPGLADILAGFVYYSAGLLTALRQARWYASRALGIPIAVTCSIFVVNCFEFWQALLVILILGALLASAAWGSFLTAGSYPSQPTRAKAALAVILTGGITVIIVAAVGLAALILVDQPIESTGYRLDKNGRVLRITWSYGSISRMTDLDGREVEEFKSDPEEFYRSYLREVYVAWDRGRRPSYRSTQRSFIKLGPTEGARWFYSLSSRRLEAYSAQAQQLVGSLGPDGFASARGGKLPFQGRYVEADLPWAKLLCLSVALYEVDLFHRRTILLFEPPTGQTLSGVGKLTTAIPSDEEEHPPRIAVIAGRSLHILAKDHTAAMTINLTHSSADQPYVSLASTADGQRLFVWYRPPGPRQGSIPAYIEEYSSTGVLQQSYELPPIPQPTENLYWIPPASILVAPPLAVSIAAACARLDAAAKPADNVVLDFAQVAHYSRVHFLATWCVGAFCAALALWLTRRYDFTPRRSWSWVLATLLLGPLALLTLLSLVEWPALESCPACRKMRVVTRAECPHCQAGFATPAPNGTEIFET